MAAADEPSTSLPCKGDIMKNSWIHVQQGTVAQQARVGVADLNEEHYSRGGFFGPVSMLYHTRKAVDPVRVEGPLSITVVPLSGMDISDEDNPSGLPTEMLANDELSISISRRATATPYLLRNVDADTLVGAPCMPRASRGRTR